MATATVTATFKGCSIFNTSVN